MRYGDVEPVAEGVKRRKLAKEEPSSSRGCSIAIDADLAEASVFDLEILDCAICTERLASPIYQCENGHIACKRCAKMTKRVCPSCKQPTGTIRCLALEKLIESLKVKCRFASAGCAELVRFAEIDKHEWACAFRPLTCPFLECPTFYGKYELLKEHVRDKHPEHWDLLPHAEFVMRPADQLHVLFDDDFYAIVSRRTNGVGDMCYLSLLEVFAPRTTFHYRMEIKPLGDGPPLSTFKVDVQCGVDSWTHPLSEGFVVVPKEKAVAISVIALPL